MTGVAELYIMLRNRNPTYARLKHHLFSRTPEKQRFVVLSWKRTGSNLLCGILYNHPEIVMHNELFNNIDIFTYYPESLEHGYRASKQEKWTVLERDLSPEAFLEQIWSGELADGTTIRDKCKAVGFKSFPEHWRDSDNMHVWRDAILLDYRVKKIVLSRESEIEVFVSTIRADVSGSYMTHRYPPNIKVTVDPARFQTFVNNYRHTFQRLYRSPISSKDTFRVTYEQLSDSERFDREILPLLWAFLGIDEQIPRRQLKESKKQSHEGENLTDVISNFDELEFCFRHTDVLLPVPTSKLRKLEQGNTLLFERQLPTEMGSWSILLPICSRKVLRCMGNDILRRPDMNVNRFSKLAYYSQHDSKYDADCWIRLFNFAKSLSHTTTALSRGRTECIVGIDVDDQVFNTTEGRTKIRDLLPTEVHFFDIHPNMYGKVCRIWNFLGSKANNEYIVLLGDDVRLLDSNWQANIEHRFQEIALRSGLPLGAACVAFNDVSFRCFPTFPVVHRWHLNGFKRLLPRQFVNQGADPYLFELYKRWNASSFVMNARLENCIGGDRSARYLKWAINWSGLILKTNLKALNGYLNSSESPGICLDVVVPSYRCNNVPLLRQILSLRASVRINTTFWIVIDNPDEIHLQDTKKLAKDMNDKSEYGDYFVRIISYAENRGASYARNTGYNFSTADWVLFLDDDVWPSAHLLDAYVGAIRRYPEAKVFVGLTEMPVPFNTWTKMLRLSNVMFFYGIARRTTYPPWGVTANLMVSGSVHNHTIQFKRIYPKSGGGEDIDFVFQLKAKYNGSRSVVSVPGAKVSHPWWSEGKFGYGQICGWAWGDSRCLTEWPEKTFWDFPNCAELLLLFFCARCCLYFFSKSFTNGFLEATAGVFALDHCWKAAFLHWSRWNRDERVKPRYIADAVLVFGASTVISAQEFTRVAALIWRGEWWSFCRRMDWFDNPRGLQLLDHRLKGATRFCGFLLVTWYFVVYRWQ